MMIHKYFALNRFPRISRPATGRATVANSKAHDITPS